MGLYWGALAAQYYKMLCKCVLKPVIMHRFSGSRFIFLDEKMGRIENFSCCFNSKTLYICTP